MFDCLIAARHSHRVVEWKFPKTVGTVQIDRDPSTAYQPRVREADTSAQDDTSEKMISSDKPIQARRYMVRGRVQGVGFRWFVEREAHILGIAGWVRNNHDGTVEVMAQGTRDQLAGLHSRLREGPRAARVDSVEVSEESPTPRLSSFGIEGAP